MLALLDDARETSPVEVSTDSFGYTWLRRTATRATRPGSAPTCTPSTPRWRHRASAPACSAPWCRSRDEAGRTVGLVYLYKQGTFYPFAPTGPQQRDNLLEIQIRDTLAASCPMEPDLGRWMALWGAPGL